jgi:hypothetical protein
LFVLPPANPTDDIGIRNRYNEEVRWEILLLEPVNELAVCGPQLGRPLVDRIHGSKIHNLKELRPRVPGDAEVRLLFVFDPEREAIVLVAGDQAGRWSAWYAEAIPLAEERYAAYRQDVEGEEE